MEKVRQKAMFCVGRAVMFGALAIFLVMLSFAFDPAIACKIGGTSALMLAAILLWFQQTAQRRDPARTETWLLLPADARPQSEPARKAFALVMEEVYLFYATHAFAVALMMILTGLALPWIGVKSLY